VLTEECPSAVAGRFDGLGGLSQRGGDHLNNRGGLREAPMRSVHVTAAPEPLRHSADDEQLLRGARVLVIDDYTVYRDYLAHVITTHGATVAGGAWDQHSLAAAFEKLMPHVVLINMATKNSDLLLRQALMLGPDARVIVIGVFDDDESEIVAYAEAGVAGYHMRKDSLENLVHLIHRVAEGGTMFSPRVSAILLRRLSMLASERPTPVSGPGLTAREGEILAMLELGLSNREIAERLTIAVHTVKNHVHSLLKKLGVGTRAQAAALSRNLRDGDEVKELRYRSGA
jgi:DNA-binding NarL/FixJ family response regulator